jgi:sugar phosphate isomerase/epimerase
MVINNRLKQTGGLRDMTPPKLAMCNFVPDVEKLRQTALAHRFSGVDWTFKLQDLPTNDIDELRLIKRISRLHPIEVRYHCAFEGIDLGDAAPAEAEAAMEIFRSACRLVSKVDGRFMTVHVGLGRNSSLDLSWERSVAALADLVNYADGLGVCVCLENLACGWSSRPELFEKLVRKSRAGVSLDIGHARVSPSVESQHYAFEDFVLPHHDRVLNAHVYHEEREDGHLPPEKLDDLIERLNLLRCLSCDWWVLELREESALLSTLKIVRQFLDAIPDEPACPLSQAGK